MTDRQLIPAEVRLAQYGERTSTWSTATYNDGNEEALHEIALDLQVEVQRLRAELEQAHAERSAAYRECAYLLADFAARHQAHLAYSDPDVPTWPVLMVEPDAGQMCWHINPDDLDLFDHVSWADPFAIGWDGHTTEEKYQRLRQLTAASVGARPEPSATDRCKDCGTPRANGQILHANGCLPG